MQLGGLFRNSSRTIYVALALLLLTLGIMPLATQRAAAYSLVTSRSIQMSDDSASTTGVSYKVSFNSITTGNTQGIVVDFCDDTPIIGSATCTTPAGFTLTASPTISGQTSTSGCSIATFTSVTTLNSNRTFVVTAAAAVNFTTTPCAISFVINGVTNPSTANHSFYARIYTYDTAAHATGYTLGGFATGNLDAGGIALSTAAAITVTAKVQEQLSFCVYTTGGCGTNAGVTLGNTQGVLSSSGPFVDKNTFYDIQTNASGGAIVNVKGNTLTSGSNTIAAIQPNALVSATGTSQFGLCNYESSGSNLSYTTNPYNGNNGAAPGSLCSGTSQTAGTGSTGGDNSAKFLFSNNAQGTYGDTVANDAAGSTSTGNVVFIGNVSITQTAGTYTTTLQFIATGTY